MKKTVAQLADLLAQVALMPWGQRPQDAQPQLRARLSRTIGSTKGSHVVLFTASKWRSRHPHQKILVGGARDRPSPCRFIGRRHPMRPPPTRGDLERKSWRSWVRDGQRQRNQAPMPSLALRRGSAEGASLAKCCFSAETR